MGTRHLIEVIQNGDIKVAQYGQWDGGPDGQGADILNFLRDVNMDAFRVAVSRCRFISNAQIRRYYVDAGDSPDNHSGVVSAKIAEAFDRAHPALSRDAGSYVLDVIMKENGTELIDSSGFATDTLFCEFTYVINLDDNKVYCYECGTTKKYYEYSLLDLPSVEDLMRAYKESHRVFSGKCRTPITCKNVTMRELLGAYIKSHYPSDNAVLVIAVDNIEFDGEREQLQDALREYGVDTSAQNGFLMVTLDTQVATELMNRFTNSGIRMSLYRDGKFAAKN